MQDVVAQSSTKAEYISAAAAANQAICLRKILLDVGQIQDGAIVIWVDNKSAICIANNPVQHGRTKHIKVKFHTIREVVKSREISLEPVLLNGGHGGAMAVFRGGFSKKRHRIAVALRVWDGGRHSHGGRGGVAEMADFVGFCPR